MVAEPLVTRTPPDRPVATTENPTSPWWVERNPDGSGRVRTALHAGQYATMASESRITAMIAGTQGGKTSLGPLWLEREIRRRGPGDYLAVTATFPLLQRKMQPEFLRYFRDTLHLGNWAAGTKTFTYHDNETRVMFGSANNPESLESASAKGAWLDECGQYQFRLESWEAIQRRLGLYMGRALITSTPYNAGWLKVEVYDRARAGDPDYTVIQFASTMNPLFPQEELDRVRNTLPAWKVRMFYEGLFDQPPGLIYSTYRDMYREQGGHLVRPIPLQPHWPRYVGVDFGGSNTAKIYAAYDPIQNVYYAYMEELSGGLTSAQHSQEVIRNLNGAALSGLWGGARSESAWRAEWGAAGLIMQEPDIYDVEVGIDRVSALFQQNRLFVFDTMSGLRDELGTYSRPVAPDGTILPGIVDKHRYHRLDALRYLGTGLGGINEAMPLLVLGSARGWQPARFGR